MKKVGTIALALALTLSVVGYHEAGAKSNGKAGDKIVWRLASDGIVEASLAYYVALETKNLIEQKSNGTIQVDVYNQGEIGDSTQQIELAQVGSVDLLISATGNFGGIVPETQVFMLHFLLTGDEEKDVGFLNSDNPGMQILNKKFEQKHLHVLTWWSEGYNLWTANKPLNTLDSWKGVKMRTMSSPILIADFAAYGASPTTMAYSELYSGLQLKTIDAQCNAPTLVYGSKLHEVQTTMTVANADLNLSTIFANKSFYDRLPDAHKKILDDVAREMVKKSVTITKAMNDKAMEDIQAAGNVFCTIDDNELVKFKEAAMSVREVYVKEAGSDARTVLEAITKGLGT